MHTEKQQAAVAAKRVAEKWQGKRYNSELPCRQSGWNGPVVYDGEQEDWLW